MVKILILLSFHTCNQWYLIKHFKEMHDRTFKWPPTPVCQHLGQHTYSFIYPSLNKLTTTNNECIEYLTIHIAWWCFQRASEQTFKPKKKKRHEEDEKNISEKINEKEFSSSYTCYTLICVVLSCSHQCHQRWSFLSISLEMGWYLRECNRKNVSMWCSVAQETVYVHARRNFKHKKLSSL